MSARWLPSYLLLLLLLLAFLFLVLPLLLPIDGAAVAGEVVALRPMMQLRAVATAASASAAAVPLRLFCSSSFSY